MTPSLVFAVMVVLAVLLVAGAMRRGLSRMMVALALMGAWLALTASASRPTNQFAAGAAARNYAIVMAALAFLYFRGPSLPAAKSGSDEVYSKFTADSQSERGSVP
jgi:hypothetical protein